MKSLKIAMITKNMLIGYGIDEIVNVISEELAKQKYEITVFTQKCEFTPCHYRVELLKLIPLPFANEFWQKHFLTDMRAMIPLLKALDDYDLVVTYDPMHIIGALAKALQKPTVMYYFGVTPYSILSSFNRKAESLRQKYVWNLSFLLADCLMANSFYTKNLLPSFVKHRTIVNYHGIEHLICKDDENVKQFKKKLNVGNRKLILSVGRFSTPYKGMIELMKIFENSQKKRQDTALLLVGRGSVEELYLQKPPRNVIILPNVSYDTLKLCFAVCDVYCTCSLWEGFNLAAVAAQANGKPVIAYNVGAHPEIITNGKTGFLVNNRTEFLRSLNMVVDDVDLSKKLGETARKAMQKFTWLESLRKFKGIIETVYANRE